ncbi:MAG TPA: MotA/TolQ/ExbB proton channel family protein, partial [Afifellaceae bacterium]|nr:MotA/TolQ/ExbB proton channel family protein [Afifellaceae bacterium]
MARDFDPYKLSSPRIFLLRMLIFLVIAGFVPLILYRQLFTAFMGNPLLNGLIVLVLLVGVVLAFRSVGILIPEVRWVNSFRRQEMDLDQPMPRLLAPMAALLHDRADTMALSTSTWRSLLDSIATRLDENREILRYLTGLLVFLGLLGTFWGLLTTISAVGDTIQSLDVDATDSNVIFEDLKTGLEAPLAGMSIAFSSSLFGLAGSLVLGFLDLQAGQSQNRFYTELEDWLSTITDLEDFDFEDEETGNTVQEIRSSVERLTRTIQEGGSNRAA